MLRRTRTCITLCLIALLGVVATPGLAVAKRAKAKKKAVAKVKTADQEALAQVMGPFEFGMTPEQVRQVVSKQLGERYAEELASTSDVYQQDRLRRDRKKELERFKKSFVEFKGQKQGWDVSIIDDQFAHRTDESMMVLWENQEGKDQRRFFFFFRGKLYKMFIQLSTEMLAGDPTFDRFKELMEARFGAGTEIDRGLMWSSKGYSLQALDKLAFHGAFCLVVTDASTQKELLAVREANAPAKRPASNIIKSITADGDKDDPSLDDNQRAIDRAIDG